MPSANALFFDLDTPLGFRVHTTASYWALITTVKHPVMQGREAEVKATLSAPDEVRISKSDGTVYLFYRSADLQRWTCAVAKRVNSSGFLVTAYRTSSIKEGTQVWPK